MTELKPWYATLEFNWPVKRCSRCERFSPLEFFRKRSPSGLQSWCSPCANAIASACASARLANAPMITAERLRELLSYNPESGEFRDLKSGDLVGFDNGIGYWKILLDDRKYMANRLAWLYMKGEWPPHQVDHEDLNRANNRWKNLRAATPSQNLANQRARMNNRLGVKGVYLDRRRGKFVAHITVDYKTRWLGSFPTIAEAEAAYAKAARSAWGEYARVGQDARL